MLIPLLLCAAVAVAGVVVLAVTIAADVRYDRRERRQ